MVMCAMSLQASAQAPEFSGLIFGDYLYVTSHADSLVDGLSALSVRRVYFTVDKKLNDKFFVRVRLEMNDALGEPIRYRIENNGARTADRLVPFIKHLYLSIKNTVPNSQLLLGLIGTPHYTSEETVWGLRCVEKTILDLNGLTPTTDFGIGLDGAFRSGGRLRYYVMAANGNSTRNESDNSKRLYGNVQYNGASGLVIAPYFDHQFKDGEIEDGILARANTPAQATGALSTIAIFAGLKRPKLRLGGSFFQQNTKRLQMIDGVARRTSPESRGFSVFGVLQPKKSLGLFARFDNYDPNLDVDNDGYNLIIAGLDLAPHESLHFLPNLWFQDFETSGSRSTTVMRMTFEFKY